MGMPEINSLGELLEFTGYAIEHENYGAIIQYGAPQFAQFKESFKEYKFEPPKQLDPREWFDIENQANSNSCAGNALADAGEYCAIISDGQEIQLSRYFAYLATQEFDGLIGSDRGSTLSGGTKAAARGLPLESAFPFSTNYRAQYQKYRAERDTILAGDVWKFPGAVPLNDHESAYRFLGSWSGPIQIGIAWGLANAWELTNYTGRGGGHSVLVPGYLVRHGWPEDRGYLVKNSWGQQWGQNGWGLMHPRVWDQVFSHRYSVAIGRSDMVSPRPRRESIDYARHYDFSLAP